jgi:Ca2+-binding RTX toxin-like protein
MTGNSAANQLIGNGGHDTINGGQGADTMSGGAGFDNYTVDNVGDTVVENFNAGTDKISSAVTYTLPLNVENLQLTGTGTINGTGNNLSNTISGNSANNQLNGSDGNDILNGGFGGDNLAGGLGQDIFRFTNFGVIDTIADYNVINDTIELENSVFTALNTQGVLAPGQFRIGAAAADANDFVIYNSTTGVLMYDANGNGAGAGVQIAQIGSGLALTNADIVVI